MPYTAKITKIINFINETENSLELRLVERSATSAKNLQGLTFDKQDWVAKAHMNVAFT